MFAIRSRKSTEFGERGDLTLLDRMRANPRGWRMESLEAIARRHGLQVRKTGGSHFVFLHPESEIAVSVPFNRPIKPVYIVQFLALIDDIGTRE